MKLRGLVPNSYIHISVIDLYIPKIGLPIELQHNSHIPILGIYTPLTGRGTRKLGDRTYFCFGNKEATNFFFMGINNWNQTFILDALRPFNCSEGWGFFPRMEDALAPCLFVLKITYPPNPKKDYCLTATAKPNSSDRYHRWLFTLSLVYGCTKHDRSRSHAITFLRLSFVNQRKPKLKMKIRSLK